MDNRLIFLYPVYTELWGRGVISGAGRGDPVQGEGCTGGKSPVISPTLMRTEHKGREAGEEAAEKSRYSCMRARTVNRHRWMRRES